MIKYVKGKTWIDWVKVIIAVDIAAVGIGLIFQEEVHVLAHIFGSISRIIFGILYIIVAAAMFKMVFPKLFEDLHYKAKEVGDELHKEKDQSDEGIKLAEADDRETVGEMIDKAAKKIDTFVQGRAKEVKEEVKKVLED